jgi:hypothetical protein
MKAKRTMCGFGLKKTASGTIRAEVCGASNAHAGGLRPCSSDMIQAVKNHILDIALVRWTPRRILSGRCQLKFRIQCFNVLSNGALRVVTG